MLPRKCEALKGEVGRSFCFRSSQERPVLDRQRDVYGNQQLRKIKKKDLYSWRCFAFVVINMHLKEMPTNQSMDRSHFYPQALSESFPFPNRVGPSSMNFEIVLCYMLPDCFAEKLHHFLFLLIVNGGTANIALCHQGLFHLLQF